jgi:hypothetical protein
VNKLLSTLMVVVAGLVVLAAAGPTATKFIQACVPLALVLGIVAAVLRVVWWYTR